MQVEKVREGLDQARGPLGLGSRPSFRRRVSQAPPSLGREVSLATFRGGLGTASLVAAASVVASTGLSWALSILEMASMICEADIVCESNTSMGSVKERVGGAISGSSHTGSPGAMGCVGEIGWKTFGHGIWVR